MTLRNFAVVLVVTSALAGCSDKPSEEAPPVTQPPTEGYLLVQACFETCSQPLPGADVWKATETGDPPGTFLGVTDPSGRFRINATSGLEIQPVVGTVGTTYEGTDEYPVPSPGESLSVNITVYRAEAGMRLNHTIEPAVRPPGDKKIIDIDYRISDQPTVLQALLDRLSKAEIEVAWTQEAAGNTVLRPCLSAPNKGPIVGDEEVADPDGRLRYRLEVERSQLQHLTQDLTGEESVQVCIEAEGVLGVPSNVQAEVFIHFYFEGKAPFSIVFEQRPPDYST